MDVIICGKNIACGVILFILSSLTFTAVISIWKLPLMEMFASQKLANRPPPPHLSAS